MWYTRITASLDSIPDFISHYERELDDAKKDCRIGGLVEKNISALDRKSTRLNSSHSQQSRMPSSA